MLFIVRNIQDNIESDLFFPITEGVHWGQLSQLVASWFIGRVFRPSPCMVMHFVVRPGGIRMGLKSSLPVLSYSDHSNSAVFRPAGKWGPHAEQPCLVKLYCHPQVLVTCVNTYVNWNFLVAIFKDSKPGRIDFNSIKKMYLFWLCRVFVTVRAFSLVVVHEFLTVPASSGAEHRLQDMPASVVVACGLSHCSSLAQ